MGAKLSVDFPYSRVRAVEIVRMGPDVDRPAKLIDRIIEDRLAKMTLGLHGEACGVARGELAGANSIGNGVCSKVSERQIKAAAESIIE